MKTLEKDIRIMYKSSDVVNNIFKILIPIYIYPLYIRAAAIGQSE